MFNILEKPELIIIVNDLYEVDISVDDRLLEILGKANVFVTKYYGGDVSCDLDKLKIATAIYYFDFKHFNPNNNEQSNSHITATYEYMLNNNLINHG